jgi:uncharacterized protein (TIGR02001 family)
MKSNPMPALALAALAAATAQPALADVSSTVTLASDYDFRGISQTALDPALQASPDVEVDGLVGFRGSFNDNLSYDVGGTYYYFIGNGDKVDFGEVYAALTYRNLTTKLWYSPDFSNFGESAWYAEGNLAFQLPQDFALTVHAGYSGGDYWDATNDGGYMDYSIGVSKAFGNFTVGLKFIDGGDLSAAKRTTDDVFTSRSKVQLTIATTLPW